jgi:hypothetical protein
MKKLLIVYLFLSMTSAVLALPFFRVAPADAKDHYAPSDWITIQLVDNGEVTGFIFDAIRDNVDGMADEPQIINIGFGLRKPGFLNYEGNLVSYVQAESTTVPPTPVSGVLYSFEYHVPEVPFSQIIEIGTYADGDFYLMPEFYYLDGSSYIGHPTPVDFHVTPEPITLALLGLGALMLRRKKSR